MESLRSKKGFICDMDGVIYHGNQLLPGVKEFVEWLQKEEKQFLFLTNASSRSPKELQNKLYRMGLEIGEEHFYTSALATAKFLQNQAPGCSAYVIGDHGLYNALYDAGITINDVDPDYVVVGETVTYGYEHIITAMNLVNKGARLLQPIQILPARLKVESLLHAALSLPQSRQLPVKKLTTLANQIR